MIVPIPDIRTVYFLPYSVEDIAAIIKDRLGRAAADSTVSILSDFIHPAAVELCARKVAAIGDLRKALEIMRMAVELAEQEGGGTASQNVTVGLAHVVRAFERMNPIAGSSPLQKVAGMLRDLNIHQKLLIVALVVLLRPPSSEQSLTNHPPPSSAQQSSWRPSLQQVFERYGEFLRIQRVTDPLGRSDFLDLANNLEAQGLISMIRCNPTSNTAIPTLSPGKPRLSIMGARSKAALKELGLFPVGKTRRVSSSNAGLSSEWSCSVGLTLDYRETVAVLGEQNSILRVFLP